MIFTRYPTLPAYTTDRNAILGNTLIWTGPEPIPAIGCDVFVKLNGIGKSQIVSYASQGPYLGLMVWPYNPPAWWIAANGKPSPEKAGLVFGSEIALITQEV